MKLTLEIPDKVWARVLEAFGREAPPGPPFPIGNIPSQPTKRRAATEEEIAAFLSNTIRGRLAEYEASEAARVKRDDVAKEDWTNGSTPGDVIEPGREAGSRERSR